MAGEADDKRNADSGRSGDHGDGRTGESLAARRRRIEMMRERQELMAMLDDFGDGDLGDIDLQLLDDDDDDEVGRWVAAEDGAFDSDDEDGEDLDDDDDFYDDEDYDDED